HVQHVDGAGGEPGVRHLFAAVDLDVRPAHETFGLLQHFGVPHHDGAAAVVDICMGQRLDGDLGAVAGRIAHGDADDGFLHKYTPSNDSGKIRRHAPLSVTAQSAATPP